MSKYNFRKVVSLLNCFVQHLPGKMQVRYKGGGGGHSYVVKGWQGGGGGVATKGLDLGLLYREIRR